MTGGPATGRPDVVDVAGVPVDLAGVSQARKTVLVEGSSDRAALRRGGLSAGESRAELEACGFFVCTADLEDELIRAVGPAAVEQIVAACGELRSFRTFQREPAHRQESTAQQLHRFMGTRSGRKSRYARLLAEAAGLAQVPRPLDRVLSGA